MLILYNFVLDTCYDKDKHESEHSLLDENLDELLDDKVRNSYLVIFIKCVSYPMKNVQPSECLT